MPISEALAMAVVHHRSGRLAAAEQMYREILRADPNQPDAIHLLGVLASQVGKYELAFEYIRQAIALKENAPEFHQNLAKVCYALRRIPEAIASYRRTLELNPAAAEAHDELGVALKAEGELEEAVASHRRAIALNPGLAGAHRNLGAALLELRKLVEAADCCRKALEIDPDQADVHSNLGLIRKEQGRLDEAVASCTRALELDPSLAEAHNNLGLALTLQGKTAEAANSFRRALALRPDFPEAHNNLGLIAKERKDLEDAATSFSRAVKLRPGFAEGHHNMGLTLLLQGKPEGAIHCFRRVLELSPESAEAHCHLGAALRDLGQPEAAVAALRKAIELQPDAVESNNSLGNALMDRGRLDDAIACYRRAIELNPGFANAYSNLGLALKDAGQISEAVAALREGLRLQPDNADIHSNLIYCLQLHPEHDGVSLRDELDRWSSQFAAPLRIHRLPHANERNPERVLRIGYVSPDFCEHVVGRNVYPVLERRDRERFRVYCYSGVIRPDGLTRRFEAIADGWRSIATASDESAAAQIRADGIDILVDLALHTAGQRLTLFARRPAPVQAAWAGYPGSTGLDSIDYRLTDAELDPPDSSVERSVEEPIRLPGGFWCYHPLDGSPPVGPLPALTNGAMTFGSLSNFSKVNPQALALWSRVLRATPGSRLLLLSKEGAHRERTLEQFERHGVSRGRVDWLTPATRFSYLAAYQRVDLGMDTFPYNGHTSSLDAAWMGVPVVTLVGDTQVGRAGLSQSTRLGLPELAAANPDQYVTIATELARDIPRLSRLRAGLRARLAASPIMDASRFARDIEAAFREMWRRWCATS